MIPDWKPTLAGDSGAGGLGDEDHSMLKELGH